MKKKIMKLVVITSVIIALLRIKLRLFRYIMQRGTKKRYQKMVHKINKPTRTSISKLIDLAEGD